MLQWSWLPSLGRSIQVHVLHPLTHLLTHALTAPTPVSYPVDTDTLLSSPVDGYFPGLHPLNRIARFCEQ